MSFRHSRILLLFPLAALVAGATTPAPREIALGGPEVLKLDWNTRSLHPVDLNKDGRTDLAVVNNDRSAIEILYQLAPGEELPRSTRGARVNRWEPVLEDARFRRASVTSGITVFDLVSGDFNGDGRMDLAYTGDPQPLTLRLQEADGSWTERKVTESPSPAQTVGSFRAADLDGDGRADLAMLGQKELALFFQEKGGELTAPERYALPDDTCYGLEVLDVNGDARPDLVYLCGSGRDALRVRLQAENRQFGPEQAYAIKNSRCTLQVFRPAAKGKPAVFAFAQDATGQFEEFELEAVEKGGEQLTLRPRVFSPRPGSKTAGSQALGDFDGDGQVDVAISDPDGAQVFLYLRQNDGGFTRAQRYPVLSDTRSLAAGDWDGDGRAEIFVASPKEQAVGVAALGPEGRLAYPKPLPVSGRPLALTLVHLGAPAIAHLAVVREEKGKRFIDLLVRREDSAEVVKSIELTGLKTDPRSLRAIDVNQDGRMDLVLLSPLDVARVFVQGDDLAFTDLTTSPGFRRGLVDNVDPAAVTAAELTGDGIPELLISSGNFARAVRVDDKGQLVVIDQFNARDATAEITTALVLPQPGDKPLVLLYDRKSETFQQLRANHQALYEVVSSTPAGKIDVVGSEVFARGKSGPEAFIFGRDRFWWLPLGRGDFAARTVATHATDLPEIHYSDVVVGDLNNDGQAEAVCIDPDKNTIEILARHPEQNWESRLYFKVFEIDQHFQGQRGPPQEPRETVIADVTGDGRNDLILLVHDRVLVYPQL